MAPDKLKPNDARVERHEAQIRGKTYSYVLAEPEGPPRANVFLVHGFPDLGFGWRFQVPYLTARGFRVVVPDMLGYGRTDAPDEIEPYSLKSLSDDIAALTAHVFGAGAQIILGGHDWGGILVWRCALWHPDVVRAVFSVCSPYLPPSTAYVDLADIIAAGHLTNFGYQLQFAGPDVEAGIRSEDRIRRFLDGMYAGTGPGGERAFSPQKGVLFDNLDKIGPSPLVSKEDIDFYVAEYLRHGLHGPLNWYRTRRLNFDEERPLVQRAAAADGGVLKFAMPGLMITAARDVVLLPSLTADMDRHFDSLTRRQVDSNHWALWATADETNDHVGQWIDDVVLKGTDSSGFKAAL